jgi:hypothetical protein
MVTAPVMTFSSCPYRLDNTLFVARSLANHDSARNAVRPLLESDLPREYDEYKSNALLS